ncbi:hypothetical protein ABXS73_04485 [Intestinimonas butyriciproducens]|uniref:hypothetical protein n=1 Tax=Intestinimonas butyriciproducens TaxID=1297617 RepID=UPI0034E4FC21
MCDTLLFAHRKRIDWGSLAILVLEVAIVVFQKNNLSLNIVELWVPSGTDEGEVQMECRKYLQQGKFVCIFRSGKGNLVEATQELVRTNLK